MKIQKNYLKKRIGDKKNIKAFLTVEAALIMPVIIILSLVISIYCFYLYNCGIIYQSCYISALRGTQLMNVTSGEIKTNVEKYLEQLLENQIYEYIDYSKVDVNIFRVEAEAGTQINNIFSKFDVFEDITMDGSCEAEAKISYPVRLIRMKY